MEEQEKETTYRTFQIWIKPGNRMYPYFQDLCQNAKNLYNTTNFYIRQVYTGLTQEKELQPLQKEVLDTIERQIGPMNKVQEVAYQKRLAKAEEKAKKDGLVLKETKCNLFELPTRDKPYVSYNFLDSLFKSVGQNDYRSLPIHSSQGVMKVVFQNWKSYYAAAKEYRQNPDKFLGIPRIPKYCKVGEKELTLSNQECVIKDNKYLKLPLTKQLLNIGKLGATDGKFKQVRVIPRYGQYVVEVVWETTLEERTVSTDRYMGVDLGVDNLAAIVTNTGIKPVLIKGKHVKSINQFYNKQKAKLLSILCHGKGPKEGPHTSRRLEKLHLNRHRKIKDIFHKASYHIVKIAVEENVGTIVIGHNTGWKQESGMGKRNNQSFCHIPHTMLINMVEYKAWQYGIEVIVNEESYTSKASLLDGDMIPIYGVDDNEKKFSGKRICRGLYRSAEGLILNADVNGAGNILRKVVSNALVDEIAGLLVSTPLVLSVC